MTSLITAPETPRRLVLDLRCCTHADDHANGAWADACATAQAAGERAWPEYRPYRALPAHPTSQQGLPPRDTLRSSPHQTAGTRGGLSVAGPARPLTWAVFAPRGMDQTTVLHRWGALT